MTIAGLELATATAQRSFTIDSAVNPWLRS